MGRATTGRVAGFVAIVLCLTVWDRLGAASGADPMRGPADQIGAAAMSLEIGSGPVVPGTLGAVSKVPAPSPLFDCVEGQPCASDGDPCTVDVCHQNQCTHNYDSYPQCGPDPDACTVVVCIVFGDCAYATRGCYDANPCTNDACVLPNGCTYTNNSAPCNDTNGCTVNDLCAGGACNGTTITPPAEVGHDRFSTRTTLVWDAVVNPVPGTVYDVARGLTADLHPGVGGNETCTASGLTGTSLSVPDLPAAGAPFWYLVHARNSCGDGSWGSGSNGLPRTLPACP